MWPKCQTPTQTDKLLFTHPITVRHFVTDKSMLKYFAIWVQCFNATVLASHSHTHTHAYVQTLESAWFWQSELSTSLSMRFRFRKYNRADAVHLLSLAWVDSFFDFQIGQLNRMNEIIFWMQYNSVMTRFRSSFHWLWCLFVNMNRTRLNPFVKYLSSFRMVLKCCIASNYDAFLTF